MEERCSPLMDRILGDMPLELIFTLRSLLLFSRNNSMGFSSVNSSSSSLNSLLALARSRKSSNFARLSCKLQAISSSVVGSRSRLEFELRLPLPLRADVKSCPTALSLMSLASSSSKSSTSCPLPSSRGSRKSAKLWLDILSIS